MQHGAIFLPGIITPAELAFGDLKAAIGEDVEIVLHDLAVYDQDTPPPDYSLDHEIDGVLAAARSAGFERFHLLGYSAGGGMAAAFAARFPERIVSLALLEPAWLGNQGVSETEQRAFDAAVASTDPKAPPGPEALAEFVRLNLREGVAPPPPPPGDPPPWMALRPGGIRAIGPAFANSDLAPDQLRALTVPVLYVLASLSNPDLYEERAIRAEALFADFKLETFEGLHHFNPPHRAAPERLAAVLRDFWQSSEAR